MRLAILLALSFVLAFPLACGDESDGDGDGDSDGDADGDSDGDADGDSDGDADGDSDGDADGDSDGDADSDGDGDSDGDPGNLGECPSGVDCIDERDQLMELLEEDRAPYCPDDPLTRDSRLDAAAQVRCVAMAAQGTTSPLGVLDIRYRILAEGIDLSMNFVAEENVGSHMSVEALEQMYWDYLNSDGEPSMQERITNCEFELVGIGLAQDLDGRYWGVQTFLLP